MKNVINIFVFIIVAAIIATGCKNSTATEQKETGKPDSVAVFILRKGNLNKEISLPGELLPIERAEIFAKISGYLNCIKVDIGDAVQKGLIIAILDAPEVIANYAQVIRICKLQSQSI